MLLLLLLLIICKLNPFVASVSSVTCSRYQIAFFLVYDEMENISMDEISI